MEETVDSGGERARALEDKLAPHLEKAKERLSELDKRASSFIREHPFACLFGALAFGYVVGRIASRNS